VGEFSFILGTVARELGLVTDTGWDALVAASPAARPERAAIDPQRSILVGYGPVGRIVHRLLADRGAIGNDQAFVSAAA
jgi:CPA2 family monovalent cation:H+ antiporter-2